MPEKRVSLLVPEGVRDWILEEIARLELAAVRQWYESPLLKDMRHKGNEPGISVSDFLTFLLEQRRCHRARRRKSALNRRPAGPRPKKAPLPD